MLQLPRAPEPLAALQARYAAALEPIHDVESIVLGTVTGPKYLRPHVFDFECGFRLVVSRDRMPNGRIVTHVSANANGCGPVDVFPVATHWAQLTQAEGVLVFRGMSEDGDVHFLIADCPPEEEQASERA